MNVRANKTRVSKLAPYASLLESWFTAEPPLTYAEAQARLKAEKGVSVSIARLCIWWAGEQTRSLQDRLLDSVASGARFNERLGREFGDSPPPAVGRLIELLRFLVMQLGVHGAADPKLLKVVEGLMRPVMEHERMELQRGQLKLDERRLELLEDKARQADAAAEVVKSGLTPEETATRVKEIFGIN